MSDFFLHLGLPILFLLVMLESFGVPLPGETALIAFAVLASQGHYSIEAVIGLAIAGAIIGDNLGYWLIGRVGGRRLFTKWKWLERYTKRVLPDAEGLIARHGSKMVFFGRFIAFLRYTAAWVAGLGKMEWWKFLLWNALGGIVWATGVGLIAYYAGQAAADALRRDGVYAALIIVVILIIGWATVHYGKKRLEKEL